jgi:hypothetical protein
MWKSSCAALIFLFVSMNISVADDAVIGLELEYRLRTDGTAHYNSMWNRLEELGLSRAIEIKPFKRAFRDFSEENSSCLFPTSISSLTTTFPQFKDQNLIASIPTDYASMQVLSKNGAPLITELSQLNGKRVALWNGLDPKIFLAGLDVEIEATVDEGVRLRMLNNDRVDAILGFMPDTLIAADALGYDYPAHEGAFTYFKGNGVSVVCFDSESNRAFIASFNKHLSQLKTNGELRDLLGPHVVIFDK